MNSITYRITGLMFLIVLFTVVSLITLAEWQMTDLFHNYLLGSSDRMTDGFSGHQPMHGQLLGASELIYLSSVHRALIWVGLAILVFGLGVSFALARSITVPLRKLNQAAAQIAEGHFGQKVLVESKDEVGQLANAFNHMTEVLAINNRLRRQLLVDVAHELKTPLTVIQGNLEGMIDGVVARDSGQLHSLLDETKQLNRMIKDLRELSLAEAGQLSLEKEPADLCQLLTRAVNMLKPLAEEKDIAIQVIAPQLVMADIDIQRLNQVVYNLLTNAIRYTPPGGEITVELRETAEAGSCWRQIAIQDTGQGIPAEHLPHIFNHFYRVNAARDRRSGGSGIGLAIVKRLVELHGGKIIVESQLGKGSIFYVYLPR
ncbi:HAMP domain-containing sensor histidine kinase [Sporomusa sphaeroides]|uniref:sensor histidine kinase n=1 Tax=Sporomusa sphaeroides TaxID=47679 RepID=UPI0031580D58